MNTRMKTIALSLTAATLALGGVAYAQGGPGGPGGKGRGMAMIDANGDGVVTRAEAQAAAEAMFTRMDVNKDGKIDAADREMRQTERRTEMFEKLDTNKDGSISKTEFLAAKGPMDGRGPMDGKGPRGNRGPGMDGPPPPPPAEGGPDMAGGPGGPGMKGPGGPGGPGKGGKHGMRHGRHGGGMMMLRMADTNNDGAITKAEAMAAAMKHFDMVDTNKDGQITAEERKAAHDKMRAEFQAKRGAPKAPAATTGN